LNPTGSSTTPTIRDSNFYQNTILTIHGGKQGAVLWGASYGMTVENCQFVGNDREIGMSSVSRRFTVNSCAFSGNLPSATSASLSACVTEKSLTMFDIPVNAIELCQPCPTSSFSGNRDFQPTRLFKSTVLDQTAHLHATDLSHSNPFQPTNSISVTSLLISTHFNQTGILTTTVIRESIVFNQPMDFDATDLPNSN
jgi:hypothetical protein